MCIDSAGLCVFTAFAVLDIPSGLEAIPKMIGATYGFPMTLNDVVEHGKKILNMEWAFNKAAGFSSTEDRLPHFMETKKLAPHNIVFQVTDDDLDKVHNF